MRRVAITGVGAMSALGLDHPAMKAALAAGRPAIGPIEGDVAQLAGPKAAGQVRGFDPLAHFEERRLSTLDRVSQFAVVTAREALAASGLVAEPSRTAVVIGTGAGGLVTIDESYKRLYADKNQRPHPFSVPKLMVSAAASQVSMDLGLTGPAFVLSSACSSANHALGEALWLIRSGRADAALAGGTEAPLTNGTLRGWDALRVMAPDTCRPFSKGRKGMILGEGAAVFVLEEWEAAKRRGANILAELAGYGLSADAADLVAPSQAGAEAAIRGAIADAGLGLSDIGYINAHGTGTPLNDPTESAAIRAIFGASTDRLPVSSTKSMHGHALGAAGALELVAALLALTDGVIPPTANFLEPDPACPLDVVPNEPRRAEVRAALSNSFAFGGLNAVLALRKA
ncbi:beta-ketoacyl-[acyl-carrier-protein] synthase family protein [Zavarzinia sp. CC-PAN008]|uniref:beta-ketoacyl-[acyl-carrier-protein] synthase family protein n=1 Tax=Zavarzinia sp. CC-PAN008 TaxID=3243332 RepID=UPI003F743B46